MSTARKKVYAWEFPVRLTHWINFLCILVLSLTGFFIGKPFIHAISSKQFIMGWVRLVHFIAAYTFLMSIIIRIYWSFAGNSYAHIQGWFPFTGSKIAEMGREVKCYLLIDKKNVCEYHGHTALGGVMMFFLFMIFFYQIFSGFAMYSVTHTGVIWTLLGGWLLSVMDLQTIRLWHHLFMYLILVFGLIHVYTAWFLDVREGNGMIDSIFSGNKFVSED